MAAIPLALKINPEKLAEKKKDLRPCFHPSYTGPIPEGWYTAQITNVYEKPAETDGRTLYGLEMTTEKGIVHSLFSERYLQAMIPALTACKLLETESVNLEDAIGRQMRVRIEHQEYKTKIGKETVSKKFNKVTEYLALE